MRLTKALSLLLVPFAFALQSAQAASTPTWLQLRVGQTAYLGAYLTDDDDITLRPVCSTYDALVATLKPSGTNCPHSRRIGTVVSITAIGPSLGEQGLSVAIHAQSGWSGWLEASTLEPIIPPGTKIVLTQIGNEIPQINKSEDNASQMNEEATLLGSRVTVLLLHQDPPSGAANLHVRVLDGPKAGLTGWSLSDGGTLQGTGFAVDHLI